MAAKSHPGDVGRATPPPRCPRAWAAERATPKRGRFWYPPNVLPLSNGVRAILGAHLRCGWPLMWAVLAASGKEAAAMTGGDAQLCTLVATAASQAGRGGGGGRQ